MSGVSARVLGDLITRLTGRAPHPDELDRLIAESASREELVAWLVLEHGLIEDFPAARRVIDMLAASTSRRGVDAASTPVLAPALSNGLTMTDAATCIAALAAYRENPFEMTVEAHLLALTRRVRPQRTKQTTG